MTTPTRPACLELVLALLGDPEAARLRSYIEALEARAALAQPEPEMVANGPAVLKSREPASVAGEPSDEELLRLGQAHYISYTLSDGTAISLYQEGTDIRPELLSFARAVLARWGRPAPAPAGEVAELVAELRRICCDVAPCDSGTISRAAELLERQAAPVPVAVSERLPGAEDCESHGWCWVLYRGYSTWALEPPCGQDGMPTGWTHWLPAHALPLPSGEVES